MTAILTFMSPTGTFPRRSGNDLGSFFWRQVVAKSPQDTTPSLAYEHGWNALNELIRSDSSWSGYERNVMFANNRDGTFSEVSGAVGLDFPEDSRSFALADLDHDGRLEVILKNRNAPQLRILHNGMKDIGVFGRVPVAGAKKQSRWRLALRSRLRLGALRQTKIRAGGVRISCSAFQRDFLRVGQGGGEHSGYGAVAEWDGAEV